MLKRRILLALLATAALVTFSVPKPALASGPTVVQVISGGSGTSSTTGTTPALTTAPTAGNLLVLAVAENGSTMSTPTGWTLIQTVTIRPTANQTMYVFERVAQSGDTGAVGLTFALSSTYGSQEYEISGEDQATPYEGNNGSVSLVTTQTQTSGTPTESNDLPIAFFANRTTSTVNSIGTGWTNDGVSATANFMLAEHGPTAGTTAVSGSVTWNNTVYTAGIIVLIRPASTGGSAGTVTQVAVHSGGTGVDVTSVTAQNCTTLPCTFTAGNLWLLVVSWTTADTLTTPTGWTLDGAVSNSGVAQQTAVFYRVAQVGDNGSASLAWSGTGTRYAYTFYQFSGEDQTNPTSGDTFQAENTVTNASITSGAPTSVNSYPLASFTVRQTATSPTGLGANWSQDFLTTSGIPYLETQHGPLSTSSLTAATATATYSSSVYTTETILFVNPASVSSSPSPNNLAVAHAGGPHQVAYAPTPTPPPTVYAYMPSYMYFGTGSGGGGGNACTSTTPCINGTQMNSVNIRYAETLNGFGSIWDPTSSTFCGTNNLLCTSVFYQSFTQNECGYTSETNMYNVFDGEYGGSGTDPAFLHSTTPVTNGNRIQTHSGACKGSMTTAQGVDQNPANTNAVSVFNSQWFQNASYINSRTWLCTMADNGGDLGATATEYGSGSQTAQLNYLHDLWTLYSNLSPACIGTNSGGAGGGGNFSNAKYDSSHIVFGGTNHIVGDPDGFCSTNPGNFKFYLFERIWTTPTYPGATNFQNNLPYAINTVFELYHQSGCNNTDLVDLETPYGSGSTDDRYLRNIEKAASMLLQPDNFDGSQGHRAFVMWRYTDCAGCTNQVPVFPEDGLVFIPNSTVPVWSDGGSTDGNGCGPGDSGGAAALKVACIGTDVNGYVGAIYWRGGTCYKYGVYYGPCGVLVNQSNQTQTIQNNWCTPACNTFGHAWAYIGSGPQTCYADLGTNLGTSSASCSTGNGLTPAANGGQSAWGEKTPTTTLDACPGQPNILGTNCTQIYLSQ